MGGSVPERSVPRVHCSQLELSDSAAFCRRYHEVGVFRQSEVVVFGGATDSPETPGSFVMLNPRSGAVRRYRCAPGTETPPARTGHCAAVVSLANSVLHTQPATGSTQGLLVIGGWRGAKLRTAPNDVWFLDVLGLRWTQPISAGDTPGHANLGSLNALSDKEAVLFLGGDGSTFLNHLYVYNLQTGHWWRPLTKGRLPDQRGGHSSVVVGNSKLVIFGGWNGIDTLSDCWVWDRSTELWTEVDLSGSVVSPGPRTDASLSVVSDHLLLLGGRGMWKRGKIEPLLIASLDGLRDTEAPSIEWNKLEWHGKTRVGHKAAVCGSMIVVLGGFECKDAAEEEPVPSSSVQYILVDQQPGFVVDSSVMTARDRIPELALFCCSECLADVRFDIQGFVFPAHRLVLCLKSLVFRRMFTRGLTESKPATLYPLRGPPEAIPCIFEVFLLFLYTYDLSAALLKQQKAPWSKTSDRDTLSRMVTQIFTHIQVDESLRHSGDPADSIRVVSDPKLLASVWPSHSLPFSSIARRDLFEVAIALLQLADEYMITPLFNICEIVVAHVVDETSQMDALQWAVALKASSLLSFLEWLQRYPHSKERPVSVEVGSQETESSTILKPPVLANMTPTAGVSPVERKALNLESEDFTIGFPTLADLPNVQSSYAQRNLPVSPPEETLSPPDDTVPPPKDIVSSSQNIVTEDSVAGEQISPNDSQVHCALKKTDTGPVALAPVTEASSIPTGAPPFPDDVSDVEGFTDDNYLESSSAEKSIVSETTSETDRDPAFPGLQMSCDDRQRRDSADHSVRSSPVRTPTFDPTFVETGAPSLMPSEPADDFESAPHPPSPARKLSQRIVSKFKRNPGAPPLDQVLKSDKSFTQRFRNKFSRKLATGSNSPSSTSVTTNMPPM